MPAVLPNPSSAQAAHGPRADDPAVLLDLTQRLLEAESSASTCRMLADALQELTACEAAVVAVVRGRRCRIEAVSHTDSIDAAAPRIRDLETVCSAATLGNESTTLGGEAEVLRFCSDDDRPVAIALLVGGEPTAAAACSDRSSLVEVVGPVLDAKLTALRHRRGRKPFDVAWRAIQHNRRLAGTIAIATAALALIPLPYQVRCDCELQPVVKRHVAAPFDGVFQRSLVKPSDVVTAGQVLGLLDAKELAWELAGLTADRDRAAKSRDVNQAAGKTAAAQIDRLEAARLDERRKLLEHRLQNLEIKTPIAGVVVIGDLEKSEGVPVTLGQSLYEVAPLDRMVVEVLVPEAEIDRVRVGQTVHVTLDAEPVAGLSGAVSRVYPRAEVRNEANVFVVEVQCDNAEGRLRPGMKGRAAVRTDRSPLFWIVTHRVFETAYRLLW